LLSVRLIGGVAVVVAVVSVVAVVTVLVFFSSSLSESLEGGV
jgi:hypothetical protein